MTKIDEIRKYINSLAIPKLDEIEQATDFAYYKNGRGVVWIEKYVNYPRVFVKNIEYPEIIKLITGFKTAEENGNRRYPSFKIKTDKDTEIAKQIIVMALKEK